MRAAARMALVVLCAVMAPGCARPKPATDDKVMVAASIPPLGDFAKQVGGDLVQVEVLVQPGTSPHVFQIEPRQMKFISRARVLVLNGINLEFWADKVIDAADNPKLAVVRTAEGVKTIRSREDHSGVTANPHVWLDPVYAMRQVEAIRDALCRADPVHVSYYRAKALRYIRRLARLDADVRAKVKRFRSKSFIAFHPAWVYFAKRYGLDQAAVIEQSPGRDPSPEELRAVVDTARRLRARAIFAEPQLSPKAAEVIAQEAGAKVLFLDPLGRPPDYDYIKTMRANVAAMSRALR